MAALGVTRAAAQTAADHGTAAPPLRPELGPARPFSFERLAGQAKAIADRPYVAPAIEDPEAYDAIDYNAYWHIQFRKERTVDVGPFPIQFFHEGKYFREPVQISLVENGQSREVIYTRDYFDIPAGNPALKIEGHAGFAGFRVMRPDLKTDWISFLGAAYFRTDGPERQYGQSARAIAIDTGLNEPEEFPRFTHFFLQSNDDGTLTISALIDGPSVSGAMQLTGRDGSGPGGKGQVLEVRTHFFFRKPVDRLGLAPLTSMFWFDETNHDQAFDWRPEVHDTDGLAMITGTGERIWRPLNNPPSVATSSFLDDNIQGFGLMQRDRDFDHYQDDGVFYNRRPSVWIERMGDWGKGSVKLIEIPTNDEIYDNIVAFWEPEQKPRAQDEVSLAYRMTWSAHAPVDWILAKVVSTRLGRGGVPGDNNHPRDQFKFSIDFEGPVLKGLTARDGIKPMVSAPDGVEIIKPFALPVVGTDRWRLIFDLKAPADTDTVDLRAYLARKGTPLTETWLGQFHPKQMETLQR
ncbi:glucan biosynthesis protein [Acidimangrovimonas sediminis]|uniref:glucan biosynthesis protein n=1 Tax=Acidimangrovimonas sediminis TaxID=2056283 RepID=UPI001E3D71D7|nr:glucan biosynthesis protein D [Acidimangrovimonas sediminis]